MAIQTSDLLLMRSALISDSDPTQNGGRMGSTPIACGVVKNVFPHVTSDQLTSGLNLWRKVFALNINAAEGVNPWAWLDGITTTAEWAKMVPGTHDDVQSTMASTPVHAIGVLAATAVATASTITVDLAHADQAAMFVDGAKLRISTRVNAQTSATGTVIYRTQVGSAVQVSPTRYTVTIDSTLGEDFPAGTTKVSTCLLSESTLKATMGSVVKSGTGSFDDTKIVLANAGTVRDDYTLQYASPTSFTLSGQYGGNLGTFATTDDAAPINAAGYAAGAPLITIPAAAHGADITAGYIVTLKTYPAAIPIWVQKNTPAGTPSIDTTVIPVAWRVESVA